VDYAWGTEPTLIFSVVSLAFYNREFSGNAAYRIGCSQITHIVPAPVRVILIFNHY
jgi:hypothetical protein